MTLRTRKEKILLYLKGFAMGIADVIPGVSGGTIAFITGIYEELVTTIHQFNFGFFKDAKHHGFLYAWKKFNLSFLLVLITGIASSIALFTRLVSHLLTHHTVLIYAFMFGLVASSAWLIGKQIKKWNPFKILTLIIFIVIGYLITLFEPMQAPDSYWYFLLSGSIAIIAMILPGISGSFILILLGSYTAVLDAINDVFSFHRDFFTTALFKLLIFAAGLLLGIKAFSGILTYMFKRYKDLTLALLTGLMIGAMNKLWPWKKVISTYVNNKQEAVPLLEKSIWPTEYFENAQILPAIILALAGFLSIFLVERIAFRKTKMQ